MSNLCIFLSPHPDDVAFSCTDHILKYRKTSEIVVITFFTKFSNQKIYSPDAMNYTKICGYESLSSFEKARIYEDRLAMTKLKIDYKHLKFVDGGFRSFGEKPIYPAFENLLSGNISPNDFQLIIKISRFIDLFIQRRIKLYDRISIFCPFGYGKHVDHLIVRKSLETIEVLNIDKVNIVYYIDHPYINKIGNLFNLSTLNTIINYKNNIIFPSKIKINIIKLYKSQFKIIYKNIKLYPEIMLEKKYV
jgi:hypothetical protein